MKQKFKKSWRASKKPGKQRKYIVNSPLSIRKKLMSVNLSKELRKKYGKRNVSVRKGDTVKIMRGKFKGKRGKISGISLKRLVAEIEGIQIKKQDGSKANVPLKASNIQITELNLEDRKRNRHFKSRQGAEKSNGDKKTEIKNAS